MPIRQAGRAIAGQVLPFTEVGGTRLGSQRFQEIAGGKERAEIIAEGMGRETELGLSPAQMTGEENLIRAERKAMESDPSLAARIEAQRIQSEATAKHLARRWFCRGSTIFLAKWGTLLRIL